MLEMAISEQKIEVCRSRFGQWGSVVSGCSIVAPPQMLNSFLFKISQFAKDVRQL